MFVSQHGINILLTILTALNDDITTEDKTNECSKYSLSVEPFYVHIGYQCI